MGIEEIWKATLEEVRALRQEVRALASPPAVAPPLPRKFLTVANVVEQTGKSERTIRAKIKLGLLKADKWPGSNEWRITAEDLDAYLSAPRPPPAPVEDTSEEPEQLRRVLASINKKVNRGG